MNAAGGEAVHAPDNVAGWLVLVCAYSDEIVFQTAYRYGSAEGLISAQRAHHNFFGGWQPWEWITPQMAFQILAFDLQFGVPLITMVTTLWAIQGLQGYWWTKTILSSQRQRNTGPLMGTALLIHGYLSHTQKILFLGLLIFEFQSSCLISCLCVI